MKKKYKKKITKRKKKKNFRKVSKFRKIKKNKSYKKKTRIKSKTNKIKKKIVKKPVDRLLAIKLPKIKLNKIKVPKIIIKKKKLLKIKKQASLFTSTSFQKVINFILTPIFRAYDNYSENKKIQRLEKIAFDKKEIERKKKRRRSVNF